MAPISLLNYVVKWFRKLPIQIKGLSTNRDNILLLDDFKKAHEDLKLQEFYDTHDVEI